jgi:hypothetical protein
MRIKQNITPRVTMYILKIYATLQRKTQQQCCPTLLHIKFRNTLEGRLTCKHINSGRPNNQYLCTHFKTVFCKTITANGETICIWLSLHDSKGQNYNHTNTQHYSLFYIQQLISHHRHLDSINNLPEIMVYKTCYLKS